MLVVQAEIQVSSFVNRVATDALTRGKERVVLVERPFCPVDASRPPPLSGAPSQLEVYIYPRTVVAHPPYEELKAKGLREGEALVCLQTGGFINNQFSFLFLL